MSGYYFNAKNDLVGAVNICKTVISLATQTGNIRRHGQGVARLAWINLGVGAYSVAQMNAHESQKLFRVSGDLHGEADAICTEAFCWKELGHYKQSLSLSIKAQSLLSLCGLSGSETNIAIMANQAEVHKCKSEYSEAWKINTEILQISTNQNAHVFQNMMCRGQHDEVVMLCCPSIRFILDAPGPARVRIPSTPLQRDQLALWICQIADPVEPMCRPPFGSCFLRPWVKIPHQTIRRFTTYKRGICLNVVCINAFLPGAVVTPNIWVKVSLDRLLVARNIDLASSIFTTLNLKPWIMYCDATLADLYIREKDLPTAKELFKKCLELATELSEIKLFCLERLGNASIWGADELTPDWRTIFLIHSLKLKGKLQVYKALQFLGQIFLTHEDENTALSLFTVAHMGFTYMDVHRSRAECMIRLGDISSRRGDLLKVVELWESARPLFERSSQAKEVQCVDARLSHVGSNVLNHHRKNIAHLLWQQYRYLHDLDFYNTTLTNSQNSQIQRQFSLSAGNF
ncbi:hypothetical protein B0H14DRAFT_3773064 [Mycena olivaceomarginata]|nr:hypothetical protein B0H14DRAFT_3773064 [Mycena olivaceomarginata]